MGEPLWITYDGGAGVPEYAAIELRQAMAGLYHGPAGGQVYSSVRYGTGLVSLAGTTITHQACNFVIQGTSSSTGAYVGYEPTDTKTLAAAHATLNRVDAVWILVQDNEADASGQRRSIVQYVQGTPGSGSAGVDGITGAPPAPTTGSYVLLATIAVPLNNTPGAVVTDRRRFYNAPPNVQVFSSNGVWNKPANLKYVRVRVVGGGGAGGGSAATGVGQCSAGGGGGGGGYAESVIPASSLGPTVAVTVGTGGTVNSGATGGNGGNSSYGAFVAASGGIGGITVSASSANTVGAGSAGGSGTAGDIRIDGEGGEGALRLNASGIGGRGGSSVLGGGARSGGTTNGVAGGNYGGGGSGASADASTGVRNGGAGAGGVVIVESYVL